VAHFPVIPVVIAVAEFAKVGVALDKPALRLGHHPVGCATVMKRPLKRPDKVYPLGKNQEYACHYDWEDRPG
jgi:hypothetical protein